MDAIDTTDIDIACEWQLLNLMKRLIGGIWQVRLRAPNSLVEMTKLEAGFHLFTLILEEILSQTDRAPRIRLVCFRVIQLSLLLDENRRELALQRASRLYNRIAARRRRVGLAC